MHMFERNPATFVARRLRRALVMAAALAISEAFEDTGVALPPAKRARMKEIIQKLEEARQEFERNIRDNKTRLTFKPDEMKGLPAAYLDNAKRDEQGNYVLGFDYPEYYPFMT